MVLIMDTQFLVLKFLSSDIMKLSRYLKKIGDRYYNFVDFFHITTVNESRIVVDWGISFIFLLVIIIHPDTIFMEYLLIIVLINGIETYLHFKKHGIWKKIRKKYTK